MATLLWVFFAKFEGIICVMGQKQNKTHKRSIAPPRRGGVWVAIAAFCCAVLSWFFYRFVSVATDTQGTQSEVSVERAGRSEQESGERFLNSRGQEQKETPPGGYLNSARSEQKSEWFDPVALSERVVSDDVLVRNRALDDFKKRLIELEGSGVGLAPLLQLLRDLPGSDDAFAPLVAAAGAVGSAEVQAALRMVLEERVADWRVFSAVVPVLGGLASPNEETVVYLQKLAREGGEDFSATASLALGSTVYTLARTQPQRGEKILENYISKILSPQTDVEDIKESLAVLGNAGLLATANAIKALTYHERADVRSEAVMALRFMNTSDVISRLLQMIEKEQDLGVRLRVIDALVHGPVHASVLEAAQQVISKQTGYPSLLREKCIDLLMHAEPAEIISRDLRSWALRAADREKEPKVKAKLLSAAHEFGRL